MNQDAQTFCDDLIRTNAGPAGCGPVRCRRDEPEAFTTSGGRGTMRETSLERLPHMDCKAMRRPGQTHPIYLFAHALPMRDRREEAGGILVNAKPPIHNGIIDGHVGPRV